jgi:hypothetical protein
LDEDAGYAMTLGRLSGQDQGPPPPLNTLDVSVVLVVDEDNVERFPEALAHLYANGDLAGVPVTVVRGREVDVAEWDLDRSRVRVVTARSGSTADLADSVYQLVMSSRTRFVAATWRAPTEASLGWAAQVAAEVVGIGSLDLFAGTPLIVSGRHASRELVARYVRDLLTSREVEPDSAEADYLGQLSVSASQPLLEAMDAHGSRLDCLFYLSGRSLPDTPEPPWRLRVALTGRDGDVAVSEPVRLEQRIDSKRVLRWETFRASLDLTDVEDGHYRLVVEVVSDDESVPRRRRNIRPQRGALISARTVRMDVPDGRGAHRSLRYLLHTNRRGRRSYLTVQVGTGRRADLRWKYTLFKKDARFIVFGRGDRRARLLRLVRLLTVPFYARRDIWIVGERVDTAQDNGFHLFRHLRQTEPDREVYYVMDTSSAQYERVRDLGNVVRHSSLRHQLLMLHASVLANAYSVRYLIPSQWSSAGYTRHLVWRVGALRVYLKHGVHQYPEMVKRGTTGYDVCLTVTPGETEALSTMTGYSDEQLAEVGMPRYDALVPTPPSRTVLFLPTWRKFLVTKVLDGGGERDQPYIGSKFQRFMNGFLESSRLQEMLERYDYRLVFLPHYNMAARFEGAPVAGDRVSVADANEVAIQDAMRECDALITDYSSVHFDVAYMGTPIIYVRFDEDEFRALHGARSWFDPERDGYGPVVEGLDASLDALEELLARDCAQAPEYAARVDASFPRRDQQNCARVVGTIERRLEDIRAAR